MTGIPSRLCWKLQVGAVHLRALQSFVHSRLVGPDVEATGKRLGTEAKTCMKATVQGRVQKLCQDVGEDTIWFILTLYYVTLKPFFQLESMSDFPGEFHSFYLSHHSLGLNDWRSKCQVLSVSTICSFVLKDPSRHKHLKELTWMAAWLRWQSFLNRRDEGGKKR